MPTEVCNGDIKQLGRFEMVDDHRTSFAAVSSLSFSRPFEARVEDALASVIKQSPHLGPATRIIRA